MGSGSLGTGSAQTAAQRECQLSLGPTQQTGKGSGQLRPQRAQASSLGCWGLALRSPGPLRWQLGAVHSHALTCCVGSSLVSPIWFFPQPDTARGVLGTCPLFRAAAAPMQNMCMFRCPFFKQRRMFTFYLSFETKH